MSDDGNGEIGGGGQVYDDIALISGPAGAPSLGFPDVGCKFGDELGVNLGGRLSNLTCKTPDII